MTNGLKFSKTQYFKTPRETCLKGCFGFLTKSCTIFFCFCFHEKRLFCADYANVGVVERQAAVHFVGQPVFRSTRTAAAAGSRSTTGGRGRSGRAVEPDQTQIAHATAVVASASPAAAAAPTAPPEHVPAEEHAAHQRRRMELVVVVVIAAGHRAHRFHVQTIRLRTGTGQPAGRGHAETPTAAHTDAPRVHALPGHAAPSFVSRR